MVQEHKDKGFWLRLSVAAFTASLILFWLFVSFAFPVKYSDIVQREAKNFDLEPRLIYAVIWTESKFDQNALSNAGAMGLMQLLPQTAAFCAQKLGEDYSEEKLSDPAFNIRLGAFYLRYLLDRFDEYGEDVAIAAYNAGEGNVTKWINNDGKIKFKETQDYVRRVKFAKRLYGLSLLAE